MPARESAAVSSHVRPRSSMRRARRQTGDRGAHHPAQREAEAQERQQGEHPGEHGGEVGTEIADCRYHKVAPEFRHRRGPPIRSLMPSPSGRLPRTNARTAEHSPLAASITRWSERPRRSRGMASVFESRSATRTAPACPPGSLTIRPIVPEPSERGTHRTPHVFRVGSRGHTPRRRRRAARDGTSRSRAARGSGSTARARMVGNRVRPSISTGVAPAKRPEIQLDRLRRAGEVGHDQQHVAPVAAEVGDHARVARAQELHGAAPEGGRRSGGPRSGGAWC